MNQLNIQYGQSSLPRDTASPISGNNSMPTAKNQDVLPKVAQSQRDVDDLRATVNRLNKRIKSLESQMAALEQRVRNQSS
jgi:peptidoglycan hydrolase CwlO-like protein